MMTERMKVKLTFTRELLGTIPKSKEVYAKYIATKAPSPEAGSAEVEDVKDIEEKGWTGFREDENGVYLPDYMIKGFFKAAAQALQSELEMKAFRSRINALVFPFPDKIYVKWNGENIKNIGEVYERPLRAMTMQGERVTLARADMAKAGCTVEFTVEVIKNKHKLDAKYLSGLFEYGRFCGLGQFRTGGYGRFEAEVTVQ